MAYPGHAYVSIDGDWSTSDASAEVWQFGIRVVGNPLAPDNGYLHNPQTYMEAIAPNIATWFAAPAHAMSSSARLRMIKVNNINPAGHYADPTTHQHDYGSGVAGGSAPQGSQIMSLVVGFLGDVYSRGPGARGRIYPPNAVYDMAGAFTIAAGFRDSQIASIAALLAILNINEPDGGSLVKPSIVSPGNKAGTVAGRRQQITHLTADTIQDVQRRRKNRATGTRSTVAWP